MNSIRYEVDYCPWKREKLITNHRVDQQPHSPQSYFRYPYKTHPT